MSNRQLESLAGKSYLDVIRDLPWGTHICQFYQTGEDLIHILVPYFKAGLENNEFCMWVTAEPLSEKEAKKTMRKAVPDFDRYLKGGQIEILPHTEWYVKDGAINMQRVLNAWVDKLRVALARGFEGMRVAGNTAWLEQKDWRNFHDYEKEVDGAVRKYRMIVICNYWLDKCGAPEIIDVINNHQFALIKREGKWGIIESPERKQVEEQLRASEQKFKDLTETTTDWIWEVDKDGVYTYVSPKVEELLGYEVSEVLGKTLFDLMAEEEAERVRKIFKGKVANREPFFESQNVNRHKDGYVVILETSGIPIFDGDGQLKGYRGIDRDITDRKEAEEALRESEEKCRSLVMNTPDVTWTTDCEGNAVFISPNVEEVYGFTPQQIYKGGRHPWFERIHPHDIEKVENGYGGLFEKEKKFDLEYRFRRKDGNWIWLHDRAVTTYEKDGVLYADGVFSDITDRKEMEEKLRESEERYRIVTENSPNAIYIFQDGKLKFVNNAFSRLSGYTREESLRTDYLNFIHPDHRDMMKRATEQVLRGDTSGVPERPQFKIVRKNGEVRWVELNAAIIDRNGASAIVGNVTDITESKHIHEQIKISLNEKEALLREIHHRVKNNLQVICSLLHLQTKHLKDKHVLNIFKECRNRIKSIALIHEALYQSRSTARISFGEYLQKLTTELFRSYGVSSDVIQLKMEVGSVSPSIDTALAFGMIINELVSNSLKHAFPENTKGRIRVSVHWSGDSAFTLTVGDNGVGLPEALDFRNTASLGMQLVCTLTNQLGGTIKLNRTRGTTFEITSRKTEREEKR